jgi:galactokinase
MTPDEIFPIFQKQFDAAPAFLGRAPGRVNLLGEHVDYNDGFVLPAAINRAVHLAFTPDPHSDLVQLYAADLNSQVNFNLHNLTQKVDQQGQALPHWALYPAGVAWALQEAGLPVHGMKAVFSSDVPIGAGLSSSAAVEVAFAAAWKTAGGWNATPLKLALLSQRAENAYVGVSCGLMDQFASACGEAGHALFFDTRTLEWQPAPLPAGTALIIADSGVRRSLTNSAYNERRASCEEAVALLRQYLPGIQALRDVRTTEFAAYAPYLPENVRKRAEHVVKEIQRVESALSALHRQDKQAFGALMYAGHNSLRSLYEVSTPELDTLVELARMLPGAIGARLTGAGFGGCTVNLVEAVQAEEFIEGLQSGYFQSTGKHAQAYLCVASAGVETHQVQVTA